MADMDKVIKALEFCTNQRIVDTCYGECPYAVADDEYKCLEMKLDALALLKEQEAVEPETGHWIEYEGTQGKYYDCSACDCSLMEIHRGMKYCPYCGAKMDNPM